MMTPREQAGSVTTSEGRVPSPAVQAVPPVRLAEFAEAFQIGSQSNMFSSCAQDYGLALQVIAESIADQRPGGLRAVAVRDGGLPRTAVTAYWSAASGRTASLSHRSPPCPVPSG